MKQAPKSWLLPSAFVSYVALSSVYGQVLYGGIGRTFSIAQLALILLAPFLTVFGLRKVASAEQAGKLGTDARAVRVALIGFATMLAASAANDSQPALLAIDAAGKGMLVCGALLAVARVVAPPSLLKDHPRANSRDALVIATILWSTLTSVHLLRAAFAEEFPLDPVSLQLGGLFSSMGSLLLLLTAILRLKILRGLQLGIGDRAWSALAITIAGTLVGSAAGFVMLSSPDKIAGWALGLVGAGVVFAMMESEPARVTRAVRASLAVLLLATPILLSMFWLVRKHPIPSDALILICCSLGIAVGIITSRAAHPLAPEGSRWLGAFEKALIAASHPEPDQAIREALIALRKAEPNSKQRPEIFRIDPCAILSVDIAGYMSEQMAEFPQGILELAMHEPMRLLRYEALLSAQIRNPTIRNPLSWFEAHQAKTVAVLASEASALGLLVLPRGQRRSQLSIEEGALLARLSRQLAGLISVTGSLKRARVREQQHQKVAEAALKRSDELSLELKQKSRSDHLEAESRVEILRRTAHSPAAQITMLELESRANDPAILLIAKVGIDPVPWAAHAHLSRFSESRPLVVYDFRYRAAQIVDKVYLESEASPLHRARNGTLVLLHLGALDADAQARLADALDLTPPEFLIVSARSIEGLNPRLTSKLKGDQVTLPTLRDRAEDLQALVINELSQLGMLERGTPYGIERPALVELIEREFQGNDDELRGLLAALAGICEGERITLDDLHAVLKSETMEENLTSDATTSDFSREKGRVRARLAPRARRF